MKEIFSVISLRSNFDAKTLIHNYYAVKWANDIQNLPKLRTYRLFKTDFKCEQYVLLKLKKCERSIMAQFRFRILPLRIETGRYTGEPIESMLCKYCSASAVETEKHFLLERYFYDDYRNNYFVNDLTNRT